MTIKISNQEFSTSEGIKKLRELWGMTNPQLAKTLGVSNKTLEAWITGSREPARTVGLLIERTFELDRVERLVDRMLDRMLDDEGGNLGQLFQELKRWKNRKQKFELVKGE